MKTKTSIAACLFNLSPDASGAIQLFPAGDFDAPRGALRGKGPWHLDAESATRLISAVSQRQNDILIDYEHQSLLAAENGLPVPAAGWFSGASLEWRETGLFSVGVKWTEAAAAHIAADEYRYLSPVFSYDPKTGVVLDILNVALTNNPAIDGMQAVTVAAASFLNPTHEDAMNKQLLALLGLADEADEAAVLAAVTVLKSNRDEQIAALTAQMGAAPDPAQYMPTGIVLELQAQLAALSEKQGASEIDRLIEANINKLPTPGLKDWAKGQSVAALSAFLMSAPTIVPTSMQTKGEPPIDTAADTTLSVDDRAKAEYTKTAALQAEFGSVDTYIAYCRANESGSVKIHGSKQ